MSERLFLNIIGKKACYYVSALCLDTFVASAAYGANQVRLSWKQILAVNGICSLCLGISLLFGNLLDRIIPETFTRELCFFSLLFLLSLLKCPDPQITV